MNLLVQLSKNSFIYALGNAANSSVGFVLIPFFTDNLTSAQYGYYAGIEIWLNISLVLFTAGFGVAVFSIWPNLNDRDKKEFITSSILLYPLLVLLIEIIIFFILIQVLDFQNTQTALAFFALVFLEVLWIVVTSLDRAEDRLFKYIGCSLLKLIVTLITTVYLIKYLSFDGSGILYGRLMGVMVIFPIIFTFYTQLRYKNLVNYLFGILRISLPLVPAAFIIVSCAMLPRLYIETMLGEESLGVFAMSNKIAGIVMLIFVQPLSMAWMVAVYKISQTDQAKSIFRNFHSLIIWISCLFLGSIVIFSDTALGYFQTESFTLSKSVFLFSCSANLIHAVTYSVNIGPYVCRRTETVLPSYVYFLCLNLLFGFLLVNYLDLFGSGLILFVSNLALMFFLNRNSQKLYSIKFKNKELLLYLLTGLTLLFIGKQYTPNFSSLVILLLLFLTWMLLIAYKLKLFEAFYDIHQRNKLV